MEFRDWFGSESGWSAKMYGERSLAEAAWNKALEVASQEVNKVALHNNTIVCAIDVINRNRTDLE